MFMENEQIHQEIAAIYVAMQRGLELPVRSAMPQEPGVRLVLPKLTLQCSNLLENVLEHLKSARHL